MCAILAYSTTPGQYTPTTTTASTYSTSDSNTTPKQSEIYVRSKTPVAITIFDSNNNNTQNTSTQQQDIIYSGQRQSDEFTPLNELPPRGDISQYRAEESDQFYHELPRSRNSNEPKGPVVYTHSNGEPFAEFEGVNDQNRALNENQSNSNAQDDGNVRARVLSVTPPPENAVPTETVNRKRIVISKPVQIQEVPENDDNSKNQNVNNRNEANTFNSNEANTLSNTANQANEDAPNGVYISTTPSTASQRIIYVQPVSQDFAQQRAVSPRKNQ